MFDFNVSFQMHQKEKPKLKSTEVLADSVDCLGGFVPTNFLPLHYGPAERKHV